MMKNQGSGENSKKRKRKIEKGKHMMGRNKKKDEKKE